MGKDILLLGRSAEEHVYNGFQYVNQKVQNQRRDKKHRSYLTDPNILTEAEKQEIRAFWQPYTKHPDMVYFAYYKEKTGKFSPMFIPHNFFFEHLDPHLNNRQAARYLDNKCLYRNLFHDFRIAQDIVRHCNGMFFNADDDLITKEQARALILAQPRTFLKIAADSLGGHGVFCCRGEKDAAELSKWLDLKKDFVAQLPLTQHAAISALHPESINSIRMMTLMMPDGVKILSSALRMGFGKAVVDNASSGGIFCGIDDAGKLRRYAFTIPGERFDTHPSTGIRFEGYQLPSIDKAKELIVRAHKVLPQFRLVAWDICIAEDGEPVLIEGNFCKPGLFVQQLANGPLFEDETIRVLDEFKAAHGRR